MRVQELVSEREQEPGPGPELGPELAWAQVPERASEQERVPEQLQLLEQNFPEILPSPWAHWYLPLPAHCRSAPTTRHTNAGWADLPSRQGKANHKRQEKSHPRRSPSSW